ncbi:MAG: hypothetical protein IJ466_02875 [Clostridia bacterium]|nr:hypothetical protein [Clostridia bacterium]
MKRIIATVICIALIATMAISGSVAYLTDEELDENVFQVGSVDIVQHEQQRDGEGKLEDFENPTNRIHPMVETTDKANTPTTVDHTFGSKEIKLVNPEYYHNYIDKIVRVENKGTSDAYIRNIVAVPTGLPKGAEDVDWLIVNWFDAYSGSSKVWTELETQKDVVIDGRLYDLHVFKYTNFDNASEIDDYLHSSFTTYPTLLGFGLSKYVDYDEVAKTYYYKEPGKDRVDISFDPDSLKILVATQAVQIAGFESYDHAFQEAFGGAITATNHPWYNPDAINKPTIEVSGNLNIGDILSKVNNTDNIALVGNGADSTTLTTTNTKVAADKDKIEATGLSISDLTIDSSATASRGLTIVGDGASLDGVTVNMIKSTGKTTDTGLVIEGSGATISDSTFIGGKEEALYIVNSSDSEDSITTIKNTIFEPAYTEIEGVQTPSTTSAGIRYDDFKGTLKITGSTINSYGGSALDLGPSTSKYSGKVEVSDTTIKTMAMTVGTVESATFSNVTLGTWETFKDTEYDLVALSLGAQNTTFSGCTFTSKVVFLSTNWAGKKVPITFTNCKYNDTAITASNILDYFDFSDLKSKDNVSITVDNTAVTLN